MTEPDRILPPGRSRLRTGIGAVVVLGLIGLAVAVLVSWFGASGVTREIAPSSSATASSSSADAGTSPSIDAGSDDSAAGSTHIFVHLLGAVAVPGLYELRQGDRAVDAVAAAGGFTPSADQGGVNLARLLVDGEQIYVPAVGEVAPGTASGGAASGSGSTAGTGAGAAPGGKVNLNTADEAALDTLPGVGPTTAQRILDWRTANGRFTAVEDLLSVSGIGEKTFADLKDLVTV